MKAKKIQVIGKYMTIIGGLFYVIMVVKLAQEYGSVPDGSSATELVEAVTPWNVLAALSFAILFAGLIAWIAGWLFGRKNKSD